MNRQRAAAVSAAATLLCAVVASAARADPSALWNIVDQCVNQRSSDYCACAAFERSCCGAARTPDADVVWAETSDFVVIRDMTMCACPAELVAGLAMPRSRVSGIEDPHRPDAIWPFAWDVALRRIADGDAIALTINPRNARTQNELHVHILRLLPEARRKLDAATPGDAATSPLPGVAGVTVLDLPNLDGVFSAAVARVGEVRVGEHGILVARRGTSGYRMVLTDSFSPQVMTLNGCASGAAEPTPR